MTQPKDTVRVDWIEGDGPTTIFVHANGFAPLAYLPLLQELSSHVKVHALATRPMLGQNIPKALSWAALGDDIARWLKHTMPNTPVVAIGHSLGATALMYAVAKYPERFKGLVVIEPAMVLPWQATALRLLPGALKRQVQPAKATLNKRDMWTSRDAFLQSCKKSGLYTRFTDRAMSALADACTTTTDKGIRLVYPKEWEAHFYMHAPFPGDALSTLACPVIGLRGEPSIFLDDQRWSMCTRRIQNGWFEQVPDAGHLLPMERPVLTARTILEGMRAQDML